MCDWGTCDCHDEFMSLPTGGWSIAAHTADSLHVIAAYEWGTSCVILGNGSAFHAGGGGGDFAFDVVAGDACVFEGGFEESGGQYKSSCSYYFTNRILLSRQCANSGSGNLSLSSYPEAASTCIETTTFESSSPNACQPVEKIIYKAWHEDPGRKDWGRPGHSHCVQPYTWDELLKGYKDKYIPCKVGGLGKRLEPGGFQTWVCLLDDHPCGDPHYCWVYHETDKMFTPWGTSTELGLHFKHGPTDTDSGYGSGSS